MIEKNNSEINVDELMEKIRQEILNRQGHSQPVATNNADTANFTSNISLSIGHIESLLKNAESRAYIRTKWPEKLNRLPFNLISKLQKFILKAINFLFKDQREVNFNLILSLKESLTINHQLIAEIKTLKTQIDDCLITVDTRFQGINERLNLVDNSIQKQLQTFVSEDEHLLNSFYVAFEDHFRGTREDILDRLKVYLPLIEKANVGTPDTPILDVGCGRGEWLELLKESGYISRGLDTNRVMIEQCQARGLEVIEADVINYLQSLPENSLGAVTGFHIIEHLPFKTLMRLFSETVRVLKPQGLVIFETPNPDNVLVGSNTFYLDPTHINPLPSPTVKFMAEMFGLYNTQIITLHPYPENAKVDGQGVAERFNDYFYGPQDYAVVGYKHE